MQENIIKYRTARQTLIFIMWWLCYIKFANSAVNHLVYAIRTQGFRKALETLYHDKAMLSNNNREEEVIVHNNKLCSKL